MTPEHLPTEQYEAQLAEKVVRLQSMMAPFSDLVPEVFRSPVSHYRMRAEFRIWHDGDDLYHIIFDQQTKSRIRVDSFPAASELINQLMTAMIAGVRNNPVLRHKLFQIDYLTTLSNQAVVSLLYRPIKNLAEILTFSSSIKTYFFGDGRLYALMLSRLGSRFLNRNILKAEQQCEDK